MIIYTSHAYLSWFTCLLHQLGSPVVEDQKKTPVSCTTGSPVLDEVKQPPSPSAMGSNEKRLPSQKFQATQAAIVESSVMRTGQKEENINQGQIWSLEDISKAFMCKFNQQMTN